MSTQRSRRQRVILPPWLATPRRVVLTREPGKEDPTKMVPARVTFQVTEAQRRGLMRILDAAKREHLKLSEGDVMRVALDELLGAVERFQSESPAIATPADPPAPPGSEA